MKRNAQVGCIFDSDLVSHRRFAVRYLPTNVYDADWLRSLEEVDREDLGVIDEEHDFSIDETILR